MTFAELDRMHESAMAALEKEWRRLQHQYADDHEMSAIVYEYGVLCEEIARIEYEIARKRIEERLDQLKASRTRLRSMIDGGD